MKKILVVDDDPMVRQLVRMTLGGSYSCIEAGDAETAYAFLDRDKPDLILLDWVLPGLSGPNLFKRLQRDPELKSLPVIIISARGEELTRKTAGELSAAGHLAKPFDVRELRALVAAVIGTTESKS